MSTISMHLPTGTAPKAAPVAAEHKPLTMRQAQVRMMTVSMITVFTLFGLASYLIDGSMGAAAGIGAFMAFWIGGGFGAIMGGALWNHHNEASLYKQQ